MLLREVLINLREFVKYTIYKFCCVFPIRQNRIIFMSHRGASQYSDSPMYITEYLLTYYPGKFEIIWEVNDFKKFDFLTEKGIRIVKYHSWKDYYLLNSSKVCISNAGFPGYLVKRDNQLRINTYHGGAPYKSENVIGQSKVIINNIYQKKRKEWVHNKYNLMLSASVLLSKYVFRGSFMYHGEIMECGLPRNDVMFTDNPDIVSKVHRYFNIDQNTSILLVAPTWRKNNNDKNIQIPYSKICHILKNKTAQNWVILLRLHHLSNVNIEDIIAENEGLVMDATQYPDVQELLYTANLLITDYSTVMWDFALRKKPIILFIPDMSDFEKDRGFYMPINEWGLVYTKTNDELLNVITDTSFEQLSTFSMEHLKRFGSYENGHATEKVVKRIVDFCIGNET